jgi:hypothetical protein
MSVLVIGAFVVYLTWADFSSVVEKSANGSLAASKKPRNSTTFFGAAIGDLPFGKCCGLRKKVRAIFNATFNPEFLFAPLDLHRAPPAEIARAEIFFLSSFGPRRSAKPLDRAQRFPR